ncbi:MAG TPA: hypothetical protein VL240_04040 [Candidatus Binatia bacterium]|nr:hypothetical protein [Candidatus Binatia bacterium]
MIPKILGNVLFAVLLLGGPSAGCQQIGNSSNSPEIWGGNGVSMKKDAQGATLEFDCARGSITHPISSDASGAFSVSGTFAPERGGPVQKDSSANELPATYRGSISGDTMHLEVVLADQTQQPPPFTLVRGKAGHVVKCR